MDGRCSTTPESEGYSRANRDERGDGESEAMAAGVASWKTCDTALEATEFAPTEASALADVQRISTWLYERSARAAGERALGSPRYGLDLRKLSGKATEARSKFGPLLTNLLLSERAQSLPLDVHTPRDATAVAHLARAGVLFALSRHHDQRIVTDDNLPACGETDDWLKLWRRDWKSIAPRRTLFEITPGLHSDEPEAMGDKIVAFLNPRPSRIDVESRQNAIYPWLVDFFGRSGETSRDLRREVLRDVSSVTNELLDNIRDHARADQAFLILSGTGRGQKRMLQLTVVDNGCGIPKSILRNKYENSDTPMTYIANSLAGTQPKRSRGRGDGLAEIGRVTDKYQGNLVLATGPTDDNRTILVDHQFSAENTDISPKELPLGIGGTVVVVRLRIGEYLLSSHQQI